MAAKRGLQQRLKEAVHKRQGKPRPQVVPTGHVRSDRRDEITRHHADLLLGIEAVQLESWRDASGIDDRWTHLGLVAAMRDDPPDHPCSSMVFAGLKKLRERRDDVDAELWLDALRVIDQSVHDRSSLRHGDRSYLTFALAFVAGAIGGDADYRIIEGRVRAPEPPPSTMSD